MIQKNKLLISMFWIVFGLVALQLASAQRTFSPFTGGSGAFSGILDPLMQILNYLLIEVPNTMGSLYFKALLFFLMVVLLLTITPRIPPFKDGDDTTKKYGKVAAWVIALMMVVFIPDTMVVNLASMFGVVGFLIAFLIVPLVLIFGTKSLSRKPKGVVFFFVGLIMLLYGGQLLVSPAPGTTPAQQLSANLALLLPYINLIALGLMIYGIYLFFSSDGDADIAKAGEAEKKANAAIKMAEVNRDKATKVGAADNDRILGVKSLEAKRKEGLHNQGLDAGDADAIQKLGHEIAFTHSKIKNYEKSVSDGDSTVRNTTTCPVTAAGKLTAPAKTHVSSILKKLVKEGEELTEELEKHAKDKNFNRLYLLYPANTAGPSGGANRYPYPYAELLFAKKELFDAVSKLDSLYRTYVWARW